MPTPVQKRGRIVRRFKNPVIQRMWNFAENFKVVGGVFTWNGVNPQLTIDAFPFRKMSFSYSRSSHHFTVKTGNVYRGKSHEIVAETIVEITGGTALLPHYVYIRFQIGDLSTVVIPTLASATLPTPNDTYWQVPLYSVYWDGAAIHIVQIYHMGDIYVPGQFDQS